MLSVFVISPESAIARETPNLLLILENLKSVMPVCPQFLNVVKAVKVLSGAKPNDFPFTIVVRSTSPLLSLFGLKMKFSMLMKRAFGNAFLRFALESLSILIVS